MNVLSAFASDFPPPTRAVLPPTDGDRRNSDNRSAYSLSSDGAFSSDGAAAFGCVDWFIYPDSQRDPQSVVTVPV